MRDISTSQKKIISISLLNKICLTLFTCFLLIATLEIILRTTHLFGARISWAIPDPLLGWRNSPESEYWHNQENNHPIIGTFNSLGWRDKEWLIEKPHNLIRIAVLGDSYVEAFQVENDRTFISLTEKGLNATHDRKVELMNFGQSGFTQTEEFIVLQNDVIKFSPDMVILFFTIGNDIQDISIDTATNTLRPFYYSNEDGQLLLDTSFNNSSLFKAKSFVSPFKQRSIVLSFLTERYNLYKGQKRARALQTNKSTTSHEIIDRTSSLATSNPDPTYTRNYKLNKLLIRSIADYCKNRGILFMLVSTDTKSYIPEVENKLKSIDPSFNPYFFEEDLKRYSKLINIEYLGLQTIFRKYHEETGDLLHWSHWNYDGHKVVADALTNKLENIIYSNSDQ